MSSFFTTTILLTPTSIINFLSASAVLALGILMYVRDRKSQANHLALWVALSLAFWAIVSTLSDVMHEPGPALLWAQVAILGPYFFGAFFLLFSHYFPTPSGRLTVLKTALIMAPIIAVSLLFGTPHNIVEIRLADWGTDFTPGLLYPIGILYLLVYLGFAASNFFRSLRRTAEPLVRKQIILLLVAVAFETASMIFTNALLPVVFGYTKASVFGPAGSLFFVLIVMYAVLRAGFLDIKAVATQIFSAMLVFINVVLLITADSVSRFWLYLVTLLMALVFSFLLVRSVFAEVRRREELQLLTARLKEANEELRRMDQERAEFISVTAHQIRSPIAAARGLIDLIDGVQKRIPSDVKKHLSDLQLVCLHLSDLVDDLLEVARTEAGMTALAVQSVDLAQVARATVSELEPVAREKGVELMLDCAEPVLFVMADSEKAKEVLENFIENAIKYNRQGGRIDVRLEKNGEGVRFEVADTGYGIPKDKQEKIFQKFFRAHTAETAASLGSGLGLYICKMLVEKMGGTVGFSSVEGKGSVFFCTLPAPKD